MTTDLERRLRALRDDLPEPPRVIDPAALPADPDVVLDREVVPLRPRRTRWVVAALVAAALVVGVALTVEAVRGGREVGSPGPVGASPSAGPSAPGTGDQVVRDGDRVEGSGMVLAVPGRPVRFCAPAPVAASTGGDPCHFAVTVTGVDLQALSDSGTYAGATSGYAHLVGTYRDGTLAVSDQSPYDHRGSDTLPSYQDPPCAAPAGGWPQGPADTNIDTDPLTAYQAAHPDQVLTIATVRPSPTQAVAYVLTSADVAAAEAALRPVYGDALCVAHTDVTPARLQTAQAAFPLDDPVMRAAGAYELRTSYDDPLRPVVETAVVLVTPDLAAKADPFPGLVRFDPLLTPVA